MNALTDLKDASLCYAGSLLKKAFEKKGLRVNVGKTKDMKVVDGKKTAA